MQRFVSLASMNFYLFTLFSFLFLCFYYFYYLEKQILIFSIKDILTWNPFSDPPDHTKCRRRAYLWILYVIEIWNLKRNIRRIWFQTSNFNFLNSTCFPSSQIFLWLKIFLPMVSELGGSYCTTKISKKMKSNFKIKKLKKNFPSLVLFSYSILL